MRKKKREIKTLREKENFHSLFIRGEREIKREREKDETIEKTMERATNNINVVHFVPFCCCSLL